MITVKTEVPNMVVKGVCPKSGNHPIEVQQSLAFARAFKEVLLRKIDLITIRKNLKEIETDIVNATFSHPNGLCNYIFKGVCAWSNTHNDVAYSTLFYYLSPFFQGFSGNLVYPIKSGDILHNAPSKYNQANGNVSKSKVNPLYDLTTQYGRNRLDYLYFAMNIIELYIYYRDNEKELVRCNQFY